MYTDDDDPLWKRILFNEILLVAVAAVIVLWVAFSLATRKEPEGPAKKTERTR
jgi:hypothetical protein